MSKKITENVQSKLSRLRKKHAHWQPFDQGIMSRWEDILRNHRITSEFAQHPVVKRIVAYQKRAVGDIEYVLLYDKQLDSDERRILMEKKEMYNGLLSILIPDPSVIDEIESEIDANEAALNQQGFTSSIGDYGTM